MEIKEIIRVIKYIEYDGVKFYQDGRRYWIGHINGNCKRLHIYVWEKYNGKIPNGYHIHHKDFNTDNNEIENLEMLTENEHLSLHGQLEKNKVMAKRLIEQYARPKAIAWHKSSKSTEFHKEHYENTLGKLHQQKVTRICEVCKKEFITDACKPNTKYCSNSCKSKARRIKGIDNVERICIACDKVFTTNKYSKAKTCSKKCTMAIRFNKV